ASGFRVRGRDRDAAAVAKGLSTIRTLTADAAKKGVFERREAARITERVTGGPDLVGFRSADLVIEAVFEDIATKRRVIAELEQVLRPEAIIASNTSALPIAEIAREARSPERIVGMHFFSPVHKMPLIEVIRPAGAAADAGETVAKARGIAAPTIVNALVAEGFKGKHKGGGFYRYDGRRRTPNPRVRELLGAPTHPAAGDIAERLTLTFVNEAVRCLDEGVLRSPAEGDLGAVLGL